MNWSFFYFEIIFIFVVWPPTNHCTGSSLFQMKVNHTSQEMSLYPISFFHFAEASWRTKH